MQTVFLDNKTLLTVPSVATIGFFDGVHAGHRYLISRLKDMAKERGVSSMVVTFDQHPREVLHGATEKFLLTTLEEKLSLIEKTGIDICVVLHFTKEMARLTAREFMAEILKKQLSVGTLLMGYDNRFGYNREEGFSEYVGYGRKIGVDVVAADELGGQQDTVSSSLVRKKLAEGRLDEVERLLGRYYSFSGKIVHGFGIGREIGFPTANIEPSDALKLIPPSGVYAVKITIEGMEKCYDGMMNIGNRPTFHGKETTNELNIFDFNDDIYDRTVRVFVIKRIREERFFSSVDQLKNQLLEDKKISMKSLDFVKNSADAIFSKT